MFTPTSFVRTAELRARGMSRRHIARLVREGRLIRARTGSYLAADAPPEIFSAARLGGRLDCVSLLQHLGVFVLESDRLHVQVTPGASRLPMCPPTAVRHWRRSAATESDVRADLVEAAAQACRCQDARASIATLDSALHLGLLDDEQLAEVFSRLPARYHPLRALLDPRSESGPESLMRLILRMLGCDIQVQVEIRRVGRVDFVVDGWLIIECDSEAHHSGWVMHKRDRRRDLAAAQQGYTTVRIIAEDIMYHRDEVAQALRDLLTHRAASLAGPNSADAGRRRGDSPVRHGRADRS